MGHNCAEAAAWEGQLGVKEGCFLDVPCFELEVKDADAVPGEHEVFAAADVGFGEVCVFERGFGHEGDEEAAGAEGDVVQGAVPVAEGVGGGGEVAEGVCLVVVDEEGVGGEVAVVEGVVGAGAARGVASCLGVRRRMKRR